MKDKRVKEQRQRREFLYYVYFYSRRRGWTPVNQALAHEVYPAMQRNWGFPSNAKMAPLLHYHLSEGHLSVTTPHAEPPANGLSGFNWHRPATVFPEKIYITPKGIREIENDRELLARVVNDGHHIDWERKTLESASETTEEELEISWDPKTIAEITEVLGEPPETWADIVAGIVELGKRSIGVDAASVKRAREKIGAANTPSEQLDRVDRAIVDAIQELKDDYREITNELIASRMLENGVYNGRTGQPYSETWISRKRADLRRRGFVVD